MIARLSLLLILVPFALCAQPLQDSVRAQPNDSLTTHTLLVGVRAGLALVRQSVRLPVYPTGEDCGVFPAATNRSWQLQLFGQYPLIPRSHFSATVSLRYSATSISLADTIRRYAFWDAFDSSYSTLSTQYQYRNSLSAFGISAGLEYEPFAGFRIGLSPAIEWLSAGTEQRVEAIIDPITARFNESGSLERSVVVAPVQFSKTLASLEFSAGYQLPLRNGLVPVVSASYSIGLNSVAQNASWHVSRGMISVGLGYGIVVSRPEPPQTIVVIPGKSLPYLKATITARGIDAQGREYSDPVIVVEDAPWSEVVPIIPYIFFDSARAVIPDRYVQLASPNETRSFEPDSLSDISPLYIHRQNLNIIGRRLRQRSGSNVEVVGTGALGEGGESHEQLARARADAVRNYLIDVWQIDSTRIRTSYRPLPATPSREDIPQGRAENMRVEFQFNDTRMAEPLELRRNETIASPPAVRFYPDIVADTSIIEWNITVHQGDKELLRFVGNDGEETQRQQKLWSLADLRVHDLVTVDYQLFARDATGQTTRATGQFKVVKEQGTMQRDSLGHSIEISDYYLPGFEFGTSAIPPRFESGLRRISAALDPHSQVAIIGYTDLFGDADVNRGLATTRAAKIREALAAQLRSEGKPFPADVIVRSYGANDDFFDNSLPEGRMLSRMVRVLVSHQLE